MSFSPTLPAHQIRLWRYIKYSFENVLRRFFCQIYLLETFVHQKSQVRLKLQVVPSLQRLMIYRWAQQALAAPADHPLIPLVWQKFLQLYLRQPGPEFGYAESSFPLCELLYNCHSLHACYTRDLAPNPALLWVISLWPPESKDLQTFALLLFYIIHDSVVRLLHNPWCMPSHF